MNYLDTLSGMLSQFAWLGNWLFFFLAFFESAPFVGLFLPGATMISAGGFLAAQGVFKFTDVIIYAAIGAIVGDFLSYFLGRWGGDWLDRNKLINKKLLAGGEHFFKHYGNKSIFWGRFFGPVRAIIPFVAGVSKMKPGPFIIWNVLSAIGWATLNVFLGYFSGSLFSLLIKKWSGRIGTALTIVLVIAVVFALIKKKQSIITYFHRQSKVFLEYLTSKKWFQKFSQHYKFVRVLLEEDPRIAEKIFGSTLLLSFFTFFYLLGEILDIF